MALSTWEAMPTVKDKPLILGGCDSSAQGYLITALLAKRKATGPGRTWIFTPHARRRDQIAGELAFWKSSALILDDPTVIVEEELTDPDLRSVPSFARAHGQPPWHHSIGIVLFHHQQNLGFGPSTADWFGR